MHVKGDEERGVIGLGQQSRGFSEFVLCGNVKDLPVDAALQMNHELNNHWDVY